MTDTTDMTVTLQCPIEIAGDRIDKLTFTRPKVKHLKSMDKVQGEMSKSIALVAALSGVPVSVVEQLDAADFARCSEVIADFLGMRRETGATSLLN